MVNITHLLGEIENLDESLKAHKLSSQDYEEILKILKRPPNLIELGIFSAMWSEHCSYKSSKKYLKGFPTKAPWVVQGPGENAGVIDIGNNLCAVFKIESHNHPSFIEPHAGAATGVGGIMRDIFTMGARPVASLNSIRFGDVEDSTSLGKKHRYLLRGVVEGIGSYGNCMGVPTIGGEMSFESCYNGNILVNAFCLGLVKKNEIFYGKAQGVGNPVIYVGSKTGRDGLGGAVMSSDSFSSNSKAMRSAVQVGDPFAEKLLLEACLELFKQDLIIGIQDMGAAGLTSSSFEMAGRSGSGMILHLDKVPMRESGMNPYELMLSESQERMLICAKKGCEDQVLEIFNKWEVDAAIIGEVTKSGNMELFWYGEKCAEIPILELSENAPMLDMPTRAIPPQSHKADRLETDLSTQEIFITLLGSVEIANKKWVYQQYDSSVQSNTITPAGSGDASMIRIKGTNTALSMSVDCNMRYCQLDPQNGAKIAVATSGRNSVVNGAKPLAISDCLNFGSPQNPEVMWAFSEVCEGIKQACEILNTPVVSGNVSLHNQSDGVDIYPTPSIVSVALLSDIQKAIPSQFQTQGNSIVLLGEIKAEFGGSLAQKILEKRIYGQIPAIDLQKELSLWNLMLESAESSLISSAKDIGEGGLAITLAKMALSNGVNKPIGCNIHTNLPSQLLFSQSQSCVVAEITAENLQSFMQLAKKHKVPVSEIGCVGGEIFCVDEINMNLAEMAEVYFESFEKLINQDL
ncbi:phosphoribosylformylglycinamidine synthase subunit PurL [Helicobacter cinaedi]|uniref:phosphoribosylformylglycinamidine synthase subunit PurL n=1 Tax=Helicobacter cinaedi TaxID=213 RepID=UPI001EEE8888|nr:phosphoribosylformylglycinamidine synthase subunit PurL [Helicobacter cinaedi]BDB66682.1 phosphoribosylformylglycinamidine synthase subunit PurL [Helicobacter cinaedi]